MQADRPLRSLLPLQGAANPLTVAQTFSSAAGTSGMVIAAWAMVPTEFFQLALLRLAQCIRGLLGAFAVAYHRSASR
jgi:hypothetical protein